MGVLDNKIHGFKILSSSGFVARAIVTPDLEAFAAFLNSK